MDGQNIFCRVVVKKSDRIEDDAVQFQGCFSRIKEYIEIVKDNLDKMEKVAQ